MAFPFGLKDSSTEGRSFLLRIFPATAVYCLTRSHEAMASLLMLLSPVILCVCPLVQMRRVLVWSDKRFYDTKPETVVGAVSPPLS